MAFSRSVPAILLTCALGMAGCGSNNSDKKANEAYAGSVCSAISTWETQVKGVVSSLQPGSLDTATLQSKMTEVEGATTTLGKQIKAVPPPDTDAGKAAKQQLDQLSTDVTTTTASAKASISQLQSDASAATITATLALLAPQVSGLANSAKTAASSLKTAKNGLGDAFKSASSCKDLGV